MLVLPIPVCDSISILILMKSSILPCLCFAAVAALSTPGHAIESIGWNYDGLGNDTLSPGDSAGAPGFEQTSWNNHAGSGQGPGNVPFSLLDGTGASTGSSVTAWTLSQNNSWKHDQSADPNQKLMNSFANRQPSITYSNIPAAYLSGGYSVVVYYGNNEGPSTSILSITGSINDTRSRSITTGNTAGSSYGSVGYIQETGALSGPSNYTVFTGLNDPSFTVALSTVNNNGICAVQIVKEAGAPSAPAIPSPVDFAGDLATTISFDWADSLRATGYQFYLWKDGDTEPTTPSGTSTTSFYDPATDLDPNSDYYWQVKAVNASGTTDGPVWFFSTGGLEAPGEVDFPFPESGQIDVAVGTALEWEPAARAASYKIYVWPSTMAKPSTPTSTSTSAIYAPEGGFGGGITYKWQITAVNATGETEGPVWTFTTGSLPAAATSPSPASSSTGVNRLLNLDWADSAGAVSYKLYLWPASEAIPTQPLATVTTSSYAISSILTANTAYNWRVDAINIFGPATGSTWSFTTSSTISSQQSIGWSYDGIPNDTLAVSDVAGIPAFQQAYWNNHAGIDANFEDYGQGPGELPFALLDNQGSSTSTSVTAWTLVTPNAWFQDQSANANEKLMNAFTCTQPVITFSGVPADYVASGYSVVAYYGNNEGPSPSTLAITGSVDDSATRGIITGDKAQASYGLVGFVEESGALAGPTNYTIFTGLNDPAFTIAMTGANNNGFCAIQIIKSTGPVGDAFTSWASSRGLGGAAAAFTADPDNDGITNGMEFVLGGEPNPANPGSNSRAVLPTLVKSGGNIVFAFSRADAAAYLNPVVEFSTTLTGSWTTASDPANATIVVTPGTPSDTVTVTIPVSANAKTFARLKVAKP